MRLSLIKRNWVIVSVLGVLEVIFLIVFLFQEGKTPSDNAPLVREKEDVEGVSVAIVPSFTQAPPILSPQASPITPTIFFETFLVTKVVDGDTIVLENGLTLRYIGIDTPETVDPRKAVQCFGAEASNKNKELVLGKRVTLEKDVSETDRYGRLLRYVFVDGQMINRLLVLEGYAHASAYPPDIKHQEFLEEAESVARSGGKGLWGSCTQVVVTPQSLKRASVPQRAIEGDKDCSDFSTHKEAQDFYLSQGGPASDPHRLDANSDGLACETLP